MGYWHPKRCHKHCAKCLPSTQHLHFNVSGICYTEQTYPFKTSEDSTTFNSGPQVKILEFNLDSLLPLHIHQVLSIKSTKYSCNISTYFHLLLSLPFLFQAPKFKTNSWDSVSLILLPPAPNPFGHIAKECNWSLLTQIWSYHLCSKHFKRFSRIKLSSLTWLPRLLIIRSYIHKDCND